MRRRPRHGPAVALAAFVLLFTAGCFGINPRRISLKLDDRDIQTMARQMAESMVACEEIAGRREPPVIVMKRIHNRTDQVLSQVYLARIRPILAQHARDRMTFTMSRAAWRELNSEELGDSDLEAEDERLTPELALEGTFYSHTHASRAMRSEYVLCTFQLVEIETGVIVWEDAYEVKRLAQRELFD